MDRQASRLYIGLAGFHSVHLNALAREYQMLTAPMGLWWLHCDKGN
jgi:hypothetical protein